MNLAWVTIIALAAAILAGFIWKRNVGLIAIAFAYIIGRIAGMTDGKIFGGFPSTLFLLIFGVMFLFTIVQANNSLSLLIEKIIKVAGKQAWAIPIILYVVFFVITSLGTGPYAVIALNIMLAMSLAKALDANPLFLLLAGNAGISGGCASPITIGGLVFSELLPTVGYDPGLVSIAFKNIVLAWTIFFIALYIFFKGWKLKPSAELSGKDLPKFDRNQTLSLLGVLVFIVGIIFGKFNPGGIGLIVGLVLVTLKVADEKTVVKGIPWSTLLMISGVSLLINVMNFTGGTDMLANSLASAVGTNTVVPIVSVVAGVFSIIAVMSSVVLPTLTPMLPSLVAAAGGSPELVLALITAILFSGYATAISPFSSGGAMYMAALSSDDQKKTYSIGTFLSLAGIMLVVAALFSVLGIFSFFKA